jgi:cell wall-associated NlpC family hydrolase
MLASPAVPESNQSLKSGDILFQNSNSQQSKAVMAVTQSRFSHCGIYMARNGREMVIECAEGPEPRDFLAWINRDHGRYVAMRLKEYPQGLPESKVVTLEVVAEQYGGKPYDWLFLWNSDQIYCSELVWKSYKDALDVELSAFQHYRDFPIDREPAKSQLKLRFGNRPVPLDEPVVSPQALVNSDKLFVVKNTIH